MPWWSQAPTADALRPNLSLHSAKSPSCVFFNDAGGGKDNAGKVALKMLQAHGVPCACYSHLSARIGEAQDGYDNGRVSGVNELAKSLGIELNMPVDEVVKLILL